MPGSFHGIGIANSALRNLQRALDVTGHNIANVNNRGYTRQVVEFQNADPTSFFANGAHALGNGVGIASVNRIRDLFLDSRRAGASGDFGRSSTLASSLQGLEGVLNEPGSQGVSAALNRLFDAFSGLAANPGDPAKQMEVQQAGRALASRLRGAHADATTLQSQLGSQADATIGRANELAATIANLNREITARAAEGQTPNDLLDLRDTAFEELSGLINADSVRNGDGSMSVFVGGFPLVEGADARSLPKTWDASTGTLTGDGVRVQVTNGRLAGLFGGIDAARNYATQLDQVASALREGINDLHRTGVALDGTTGLNFFSGTGAGDMALAPEIASDASKIASGTTGKRGDGDLASAMAAFRETALTGLGGRTIEGFYRDVAARIGTDAAGATDEAEIRRSVLDQVDAQKMAVSGVSLDEEMANMLQLQRSYQAAAKTLSMFDQMTQELLATLGR